MRAYQLLVAAAAAGVALLGAHVGASHLPPVVQSRDDTKVTYKGRDFGYSGYASVPVEGTATKVNHIFWWYQPPLEAEAASKDFPVLIWLQGVSAIVCALSGSALLQGSSIRSLRAGRSSTSSTSEMVAARAANLQVLTPPGTSPTGSGWPRHVWIYVRDR